MAAILGLDDDKVIEACSEASSLGIVSPANFNSPGQVVISGAKAAVEKASGLCQSMGAKKVVPLAVSVPSHSMMMAPAAERFREELDKTGIKDLHTAVVSNATAKFVTSAEAVKDALIKQLTSPLLWVDCVNALVDDSCGVIIEVGPGKVLSGLIKRITKKAEIRNVMSESSLNTTLDYLSMGCKFPSKK
jgi:[acyl-carrier-protein] S-malonyltransferase